MLLCVDGLHGFGVEDETAASLGCDVFVAGTHKWLWGPRGTGIVWATQAAWDSITSITAPFEQMHFDGWINDSAPLPAPGGPANTPGGYVDFEHRMAMKEAFEFHQLRRQGGDPGAHAQPGHAAQGRTGRDPRRPAAHADGARTCRRASCASRSPTRVGSSRSSTSSASAGYSTSITPYRDPYLRIGPSIVTNPDQVDGLLAAMREILAT